MGRIGSKYALSLSIEHLYEVIDRRVVGAGYLRVPHPRQYDLAPSRRIEDDVEQAEIFQVSVIHQLHCMVRGHVSLSRRDRMIHVFLGIFPGVCTVPGTG